MIRGYERAPNPMLFLASHHPSLPLGSARTDHLQGQSRQCSSSQATLIKVANGWCKSMIQSITQWLIWKLVPWQIVSMSYVIFIFFGPMTSMHCWNLTCLDTLLSASVPLIGWVTWIQSSDRTGMPSIDTWQLKEQKKGKKQKKYIKNKTG